MTAEVTEYRQEKSFEAVRKVLPLFCVKINTVLTPCRALKRCCGKASVRRSPLLFPSVISLNKV